MSNDEKQLTDIADEICNSLGESRMAVLCALRRGTVIAYEQARSEVIEEAKLELLKLVEGLSDPEPYVEFNDVINILTKLERGAE